MKMLRVHGQNKRYHHRYIGLGGRLDTIQAAVLLAKLPHYKNEIEKRQGVALKFSELLGKVINIPKVNADRSSVWAQYTIRVTKRNEMQEKLKKQSIPTAVHYPMPLHMQECFQYLGFKQGDFPVAEQVAQEVMSLPMNPFLTDEEVNYIADALKLSL